MADFLEELARRIPKAASAEPEAPKVALPKRPSGPSNKGGYAPVEVLDPEGSDVVAAFLAHILNEDLCSDHDREVACRTLMNRTGRKLDVTCFDVAKTTLALTGLVLSALVITKMMYAPKSGTLYLNLVPQFLGVSSCILFSLTLAFRRQPDYILTILCGSIGILGAIALSSKI